MAGLEEWSSSAEAPRKAGEGGTEFGLRLAATFFRSARPGPDTDDTMSSYLVTGGAGFIGSHLAEELVRRGHRVRVVDSLITGKRRNLEHLPGVEFIEGDLADVAVAAPRGRAAWTTCCIRRPSRRCRGR